jgi:hypothetical protein
MKKIRVTKNKKIVPGKIKRIHIISKDKEDRIIISITIEEIKIEKIEEI